MKILTAVNGISGPDKTVLNSCREQLTPVAGAGYY